MPRISVLQKYLNHYAEQEIKVAQNLNPLTKATPYHHVLVIPCFDESPTFAQRLLTSELWEKNILVIVVINQSQGSAFNINNNNLWHFFQSLPYCKEMDNALLCGNTEESSHFLVVDRFQNAKIPKKEGVGLARKIGCDIACGLISVSMIKQPWIHNTDADAILPAQYFDAGNQAQSAASAIIYNFEHVQCENGSIEIYEATKLYESTLRYYFRGLQWAGSPYAFYTIGSTLAFHAEAYAQCRGFPKRAGAEDFYLLNKLAKVGSIQFYEPACVKICARVSQRAPFGTGQAVQSIIEQQNKGEELNYYAPECFELLKQWLSSLEALWNNINPHSQTNTSNEYKRPIACEPINTILCELNFSEFENHVQRQIRSFDQFQRAFLNWFDAFKTLKFIRLSQQYYYPAKPFFACQKEAPF